MRSLPTDRPLSARQREVLRLAALGLPNKRIARELGIAYPTVKIHMANIYEKLGVTNRTAATVWWFREGAHDGGTTGGGKGGYRPHDSTLLERPAGVGRLHEGATQRGG
jgi:DNA-binding CsgD family transcriptional regulator